MKAPAGRPGLDVRRGGERAAPRCRHLPAEARAAGPRAAGDQRPAAGGEGAPGGRSAARGRGSATPASN